MLELARRYEVVNGGSCFSRREALGGRKIFLSWNAPGVYFLGFVGGVLVGFLLIWAVTGVTAFSAWPFLPQPCTAQNYRHLQARYLSRYLGTSLEMSHYLGT